MPKRLERAQADPADDELLRVEVLGAVRAWHGDREISLGGPRQRAVFAVLAMRANHAVSRAELIQAVWGQDPPPSADSSVYTYVTGLRRVLEPGRARRSAGDVLTSTGSGYRLRLAPGAVDAEQVEEHVGRAHHQRAAGGLADAARSLETALGLWRGTPFGGISGPFAETEQTRLGERRLAVYAERAAILLTLGLHAELTVELPGLVAEHPLDERLRGLLMLALYRSGRQAEALAEFQQARRVFTAELGVEPGPELRRLHEQFLAADPVLDPQRARVAAEPDATARHVDQPGTPEDADQPLDRAARDLAAALARQWAAEADRRSLYRPEPVRLRWSATGRTVAALPTTGYEHLHGDLIDLVPKFRRLPKRQLVVIGEPGAGKTVLAILLTLGLLNDPAPGDPVPGLFPLPSWDPEREHLHTWLVRRLVQQYPALADSAVYGPDAAARLVTEGRVLPVLDGLDELPPALRLAAIDALDRMTAGGHPLVVTCRSAEYEEAVELGGTIAGAAVAEIEPVAVDDTVAYLAARHPVSHWQPVVDQLRRDPGGPLAQALSTPLMVSLARAAYASPPADPAELCDAGSFPDRASIEEHLLDAFLPSVYAVSRYRTDRVQRWLAPLAAQAARRGSGDLCWWQFGRPSGLVAGLIGAVVFGLAGLAKGLAAGVTGGLVAGLGYAAAFGVAIGLAVAHAPPLEPVEIRLRGIMRCFRPLDLVRARSPRLALTRDRAATLTGALVAGAAVGTGCGLATGLSGAIAQPSATLTYNMMHGLVGLAVGIAGGWLVYGRAGALLFALPSAIAAGLTAGVPAGALVYGLAMALAVGYLAVVRTAWGGYTVGRIWPALLDRQPWRMMRFLEDAHRQGVLRQAGAVYQFRHARLQDRLVRMN